MRHATHSSIKVYEDWSVTHSVLICDDVVYMRSLVGDILGRAGFEVVGEAATGAQAVEKYKELRPDFVTARSRR